MTKRAWLLTLLVLLLLSACSPSAAPQVAFAPASSGDGNGPQLAVARATNTTAAIFAPTATSPKASSTIVVTQPAISSGGTLTVTYIDVGQGDSTLITTPNGKYILIDGGEADQNVVAKLKNQGVTSLDTIIATHAHADHIGGLPAVIRSIKTGQVITNSLPYTTKTFENLLDAIQQTGAGYKQVKRGDKLTLGGVDFLVMNPAGDLGDDQNNNSVVLLATYIKSSFLFMGDAEHEAEASILASGLPVKADVLKAGHHCSSTSSSSSFVDMVKPLIAICFVGADNTYGHPHKQTLTTYASRNIPLYVTESTGSVTVTTDGATYNVTTAKTGQAFTGLAAGGTASSRVILPPVAAATSAPPAVRATIAPTVSGQNGATFDVVFSMMPGSVKAGSMASAGVHTSPSASCTIVVTYKSGPSKAKGLDPQIANSNGDVSWSWSVGSNTSAGSWPVDVSCSANGASKSARTQVTVTK